MLFYAGGLVLDAALPKQPQKPQKPRKPRKLKYPALLAEEAAFKLAAGRRLFMCRMLIIDNRTWFADKMGVTMTHRRSH